MSSCGSCANATPRRMRKDHQVLTVEVEMEQTVDEIMRLQGCLNDLVSVLALPAIWSGHESSQIVSTLLDVLLGMLRLDFAYVRVSDAIDGAPIEMLRSAQRQNPSVPLQEVGRVLNRWLTDNPLTSPVVVPNPIGAGKVSIVPLRLGLQEEVGVFVAASRRTDFPTQSEILLLRVATNQTAIGLQEARRLSEQRRATEELEQRVVERTRQLTGVNEELRKEIIERKRAESLLSAEKRTLEMIAGGSSLTDVLEDLCRAIDAQAPNPMTTVLLMDPDGKRLWPTAGPRVPSGWTQAITPLEIGPCVGSCGTAAFLKKMVITSDIAIDPLWVGYQDVALSHGLRAAWSQPLLSKNHEVLGTVAMYFAEPRSPSASDFELIKGAGHIALIAIEHKRAEEALTLFRSL